MTGDAATLKQCCAQLYTSDLARMVLGESFHPGGLRLTERVGMLLKIRPESRVLDVASGTGVTALFLTERFGCQVVGVDFSEQNTDDAERLASTKALSSRVRFERGDAEDLPFPEDSFDAIICECAFCTFPDKRKAASEFARVLCAGGRIGLSDLTRRPVLLKELDGLLAWISCIADAQSVDGYADYLRSADFHLENVEVHDEALAEMVRQIGMKLLNAEVLVGLKKLALPDFDFKSAKKMAQSALIAVRQGQLGYAVLTASKTHTQG